MKKEDLAVGDRVEWITGNGNTMRATVTAVPANEWDDEVEVEIYYEDDPDNCDDPGETWEPGDSYTTVVSASRLSLIELACERAKPMLADYVFPGPPAQFSERRPDENQG